MSCFTVAKNSESLNNQRGKEKLEISEMRTLRMSADLLRFRLNSNLTKKEGGTPRREHLLRASLERLLQR